MILNEVLNEFFNSFAKFPVQKGFGVSTLVVVVAKQQK